MQFVSGAFVSVISFGIRVGTNFSNHSPSIHENRNAHSIANMTLFARSPLDYIKPSRSSLKAPKLYSRNPPFFGIAYIPIEFRPRYPNGLSDGEGRRVTLRVEPFRAAIEFFVFYRKRNLVSSNMHGEHECLAGCDRSLGLTST
jgi:hypothetical protein